MEQIGAPNEIYNHPKTEFVCNFIGDINRVSDALVRVLVDGGAEIDPDGRHYIRLERLHVNEPVGGNILGIQGTVESIEYYGLYIKYYIYIGSQILKVIEKNDGVRIYEPGEQVTVNLNPADLMSYPAPENNMDNNINNNINIKESGFRVETGQAGQSGVASGMGGF